MWVAHRINYSGAGGLFLSKINFWGRIESINFASYFACEILLFDRFVVLHLYILIQIHRSAIKTLRKAFIIFIKRPRRINQLSMVQLQ